MPPFTSTNWTTLVRKVVSAARQATVSTNRTLASASRLTRIQRAKLSLRHTFHETFPSLHTPSYTLNAQLSQSTHRTFTQTASKHYQSPYARAGQAFRMSPVRPSFGPQRVGLGISPVRTFASAPAAGSIASNAPIYLRAFIKSLDLDDPSVPKRTLYAVYKPRRRGTPVRQSRKRMNNMNCSRSSIISTVHADSTGPGSWPYTMDYSSPEHVDSHRHYSISDIEHYFPLFKSTHTPTTPERPNLLLPEKLVHPGTTSILTVGLSSTFQEILEQTTNVSYRDAEIGLTVFANLFGGLIPLMTAFEKYRSSRVVLLIAKLESLGLIDTEGVGPSTHLEYTMDSGGNVETLRVVFEGRNEGDVRGILGETLLENGGEVWFAMHEEEERVIDNGNLSPTERRDMSECWDSPTGMDRQGSRVLSPLSEVEEIVAWGATPIIMEVEALVDLNVTNLGDSEDGLDFNLMTSNADLIFPSPNTFSGQRLTIDENNLATITAPEPYTYPSSLLVDSPNESEWSTPSASYISDLVGSQTPSSEWSAPPSEVDSDLDSDMAMSVWSGGEEMEVESVLESRPPSPDEEDSWRETIRGGGLMQPW